MTSLLLLGTADIVCLSVFGALFLAIIIYYCCTPIKSLFVAMFAGCYIPSFKLISLKNRKLNVSEIVSAYIMSKKSNRNLSLNEIEAFVLSGGNIINVLKALKLADDTNIKLDYKLACAIELSSKDVLQVVKNSITSTVETVEDIRAFTQDNIEVIVKAKFSTKVNLDKYLNGLGIEDLKNTVKGYILEKIAKAEDYKQILSRPNECLLSSLDLKSISHKYINDIIDINIVSVDLGRNLNLEDEIKRAEKEKIYAQIEAERKKNIEEINEYRMRAKTEEMKSVVLQAEAEVPQAISQAIKEGRFSVMDYYKLMNLQADTALRRAIIKDNKNSNNDDGDLY